MTSVIGISAFCLHCRASTTLLAAFLSQERQGPCLINTNTISPTPPDCRTGLHTYLPVERSPFAYILKWRLRKKEERERGGKREGGEGWGRESGYMQTRLSSNMQEPALLWHKSASELRQRERSPSDSKWARDGCQIHRGTLCYPTENRSDWSVWHVTYSKNYKVTIVHA